VQSHFDGVRAQVERLGDLARCQVGAVAQRDQLAVALVEARDRVRQHEAPESHILEVALVKALGNLPGELEGRRPPLDQPSGDADQPGQRLTFLRVVALAVAERPFEGLARQVLRVRPTADAVRDVRVDALDQGLRVAERVNPKQRSLPRRRCGGRTD
jgi:hypothetical protein